jgi:hypothetical protein
VGELTRLAEGVAAGGDHERAEALTAQISDPDLRARALARLARLVAAGGDHDKAEALVALISNPGLRVWALARLAGRVATGWDHDKTEVLIAQISGPDRWALALARVAVTLVEISQETPPAAEHAHSSSPRDGLSAPTSGRGSRDQFMDRSRCRSGARGPAGCQCSRR